MFGIVEEVEADGDISNNVLFMLVTSTSDKQPTNLIRARWLE